jgi:hypothetical protein
MKFVMFMYTSILQRLESGEGRDGGTRYFVIFKLKINHFYSHLQGKIYTIRSNKIILLNV